MIDFNLTMVVFLLLFVVSLIDLRTKRVPAFFSTAIIFMIAMTNMYEIQFGLIHLGFGVLAFLFAYMLYESNFIGGVADIKVLVMIGMMVKTIPTFFLFMILVLIFGFAYKLGWRYLLKYPETAEIPFIISFWAVYVILWINGGLI